MIKYIWPERIRNWWKDFEENHQRNWLLSIIWLIIISSVAFLWNLGSIGLLDKTEPMFVEAARQMVVTGDWITPHWNGETRFDKPPLVYWLMAIAFKIIGVNEWAARLPSALAAIAFTVLGFYTLRYFGFPRPIENSSKIPNSDRKLWVSAWIGAGIIALNPAWIAWGRTGVSDMLLASNFGMALLAFFIGYAKEKGKKGVWYFAFYVFVALAILAKGPVGLILPGLIISAFLLYLGKFREVIREMRLVRGFLIIAAIAIPWFILVTLANGKAYIDTFFGYHNLQRFTSVVSDHPGPWYYFLPVVLVGLAPWSIYLPVAIARLRFWERDLWKSTPRFTHLGLFALFWFVCVLGFFSISVTKLPSYVLPLMPAGAILITLFWCDRISFGIPKQGSKRNSGLFLSAVFNIVFLLILAAGTFLSPKLIGYDPDVPQLRQALERSSLPTLSGVIWSAAAVVSLFLLLQRQRWRWLWSTNLAAMLAFTIFVAPPAALLMDKQRQLPVRQISALVTKVRKPGEELIMIGFIRPSLVYYTKRTVNFIKTPREAFAYIKKTAATRPNPPTVLIVSKPITSKSLFLRTRQYQELGKAGAYKLLRVSKKSSKAKKWK